MDVIVPRDATSTRSNARSARTRRIPNFRLRSEPKTLLLAALEVFAKTSFKDAPVSSVTRRLGLSKGALYLHFSSKQELFERMIDEFCVVGKLDDGDGAEAVGRALRSGPAADVLGIVLREWPAMPEIGPRYLEAVTKALASRLGLDNPADARGLALTVLAPAVMEAVFLRAPASTSE